MIAYSNEKEHNSSERLRLTKRMRERVTERERERDGRERQKKMLATAAAIITKKKQQLPTRKSYSKNRKKTPDKTKKTSLTKNEGT